MSTFSRELATDLINHIKNANPTLNIKIAGSYRRKKQRLNDLDILLISKTNKWAADADPISNLRLPQIIEQNNGIIRRMTIIRYKNTNIKCDIYRVDKDILPFMLFHATGDRGENLGIRRLAIDRGWSLNQYGIWYRDNRTRRVAGSEKIKTEKDIYEFFGREYRKPEDRDHNIFN